MATPGRVLRNWFPVIAEAGDPYAASRLCCPTEPGLLLHRTRRVGSGMRLSIAAKTRAEPGQPLRLLPWTATSSRVKVSFNLSCGNHRREKCICCFVVPPERFVEAIRKITERPGRPSTRRVCPITTAALISHSSTMEGWYWCTILCQATGPRVHHLPCQFRQITEIRG